MPWSAAQLSYGFAAINSFLPMLYSDWDISRRPVVRARGQGAVASITAVRISDGLEKTVELELPDTITTTSARQWVIDIVNLLNA